MRALGRYAKTVVAQLRELRVNGRFPVVGSPFPALFFSK
jgi:hypothetical protein